MQRLIVLAVSSLLGIGMWAAGEAVAYSAAPVTAAAAPGRSAICQPTIARQAMAGVNVGLTLAQARACWPDATVSANGVMPTPGDYLIPHGRGWIHAGWSIGAIEVAGRVLASRDALAYSCGQLVTWTVQSWEQWLDYILFTTGEAVNTCYSAWSNWETPACSGFGKCLAPAFGVLGQHTATVNPWYNQTVDYLALTEFFYCRHYVSAQNAISAYCG